ncbi:hypothetical protein Vafri_339, partial [Volvox africanus]
SAGASFTPSPVIATTWPCGQRKEEKERDRGAHIHRRARLDMSAAFPPSAFNPMPIFSKTTSFATKPQQNSTQHSGAQHIAHSTHAVQFTWAFSSSTSLSLCMGSTRLITASRETAAACSPGKAARASNSWPGECVCGFTGWRQGTERTNAWRI